VSLLFSSEYILTEECCHIFSYAFLELCHFSSRLNDVVDSSWNVMAHGDAREGKWRGNWRVEWVANTLHTISEHGVSSITTKIKADAHTSAASSRLNWRPRRFKWTRPLRRKTKSGFCACAITFNWPPRTGIITLLMRWTVLFCEYTRSCLNVES